jgi:hypothetical protein
MELIGQACLSAGGCNSLSRSAECRPAHLSFSPTACVSSWPSLLARANESFDCLALEGSAPCGHTVAAGARGGTAGPAGPPGSLIAVASVSGPSVRPGKSLAIEFSGTRGASKRDAVSALNPQGEERTSRSAPNFIQTIVTLLSIRTTKFGWARPNRVFSQAVFQNIAVGHPKFGAEREVCASTWDSRSSLRIWALRAFPKKHVLKKMKAGGERSGAERSGLASAMNAHKQ